MIHNIYLSIGSNIEPEKNLTQAIFELKKLVGIQAVSSAWRSAAVGTSGPVFLNAAILVGTPLSAADLKAQVLLPIETKLGRIRTTNKNAPRPIDLDIIIFDEHLLDEELWNQAHIAVPLAEIFPGYTHPDSEQIIAQAAKKLGQQSNITQIPNLFPFS